MPTPRKTPAHPVPASVGARARPAQQLPPALGRGDPDRREHHRQPDGHRQEGGAGRRGPRAGHPQGAGAAAAGGERPRGDEYRFGVGAAAVFGERAEPGAEPAAGRQDHRGDLDGVGFLSSGGFSL